MQSVKKNFLYQSIYEVLFLLLPLMTSPYISRVLGASNIGIYAYTYSIVNYFVLFCNLGIKNYGNREISRNRDNPEKLNRTFSGILFLHFLISAIVFIVYIGYILYVKKEYRLYVIIQSLYVISAFIDISWLFFGLEEFKITVTRNSIIKIVSALSIFVFVRNQHDLWIYILILAAANLFSNTYLWFYVKKYVTICRVPRKEIVRHLPQMFVLFIPGIAVSLYNYMDKIMLGSMTTTVELGFYENAEKITTTVFSIIGALGTVMLPRMSNIAAKGETDKAHKYIENSMKLVMCLSFALSFGIAAVAEVFSPIFWGNEFTKCDILIKFLSIIVPIKAFANVLRTQYLIPNKIDRGHVISVCCGAIVNVILNILLIPHLRSLGATIGTIAAEFSVCIVVAVYSHRELPLAKYIKNGLIYILFGVVMYIPVNLIGRCFETNLITLIVQIVTGTCLYGTLCLAYFLYNKVNPFYSSIIAIFNGIRKS